MTFVFYDTETTGLNSAFDQILQFAAIVTDDNFNPIDELNLRCRLQPHIVASPGAIHITRVGPRAIQEAPLSFYEMVRAIQNFVQRWTPATFIGFNSIDYDENMLRSALYQTLHPTFLTNTNGNSRMDVLRLAHAVAEHRPDAITVPLSAQGRPTFRLAGLVEANGLLLDQAHDALSDTRATLALTRHLRDRAPEIWDHLYACRSRRSVEAVLENNDLVLFTDRRFTKATILAGLITQHPGNPANYAMFDLADDPAQYLDVDQEGARRLLASNPRPIRTLRANALPILCPYRPDAKVAVDPVVARERLTRIRAHPTFAINIGKAMVAKYADAAQPVHVEQRIYEGFPGRADQRLMEAFHNTSWEDRFVLVERFEDPRFRELAERLIYYEHPSAIPAERRTSFDGWRRDRMTTTDKVPWLSLTRARAELEDLKSTAAPEFAALVSEIEDYLHDAASEFGVVHYRRREGLIRSIITRLWAALEASWAAKP